MKTEKNTYVLSTYAACCVLVFICAVFTPAPGEAGEPGEPVRQRILNAYKTMVDIQGEFSQESRIKELDETKSARGRFYIRRPDRVRWDYLEPARQTVVITGNEMLIRQGDDGEIMKRELNSAAGSGAGISSTPIGLLSDLGNMDRDFVVKPDGPQAIFLTPRSDMGIVKSIRIGLNAPPLSTATNSSFPVESLRITDAYGNVNIFTLKNVLVNKGLGDDVFVP